MFVRYLGGGIGHLEQFPSADNNDEDTTMDDNGDVEVETVDFITDRSNDDNREDGGGEEGEDKEGEDKEDEGGDEGEEDDPGESSDEEMGKVY